MAFSLANAKFANVTFPSRSSLILVSRHHLLPSTLLNSLWSKSSEFRSIINSPLPRMNMVSVGELTADIVSRTLKVWYPNLFAIRVDTNESLLVPDVHTPERKLVTRRL
jgi:hypothetical protein